MKDARDLDNALLLARETVNKRHKAFLKKWNEPNDRVVRVLTGEVENGSDPIQRSEAKSDTESDNHADA